MPDRPRVTAHSLDEAYRRRSTVTRLELHVDAYPDLAGTLAQLVPFPKLEELKLTGACDELPAELGGLTRLRSLQLDMVELARLPEEIGSLRRLRNLEIDRTRLDALPASIGELTRLETLSLYQTLVSAPLPESLGDLRKLRTLRLFQSHIAALPPSIGRLSALETFEGTDGLEAIPPELGQLRALRTLSLSGVFTTVPDELGELAQLVELRLDSPRLHTLPASLSRLTGLRVLELPEGVPSPSRSGPP